MFTWFLAHCDDQGRYSGGAKKVKAEVAPLLDEISIDDVETELQAMDAAGLIMRYSEAGRNYIQIIDWWEFNAGLRYASKSRHPAPENWIDNVTARDGQGRFIGGRRGDALRDFATTYAEDIEDEEEEGRH